MDAPAVLYAFRWLIYDTFRQAISSRVFWIMLGLSGICIVFCLGVSVQGGTVREEGELFDAQGKLVVGGHEPGQMWLMFGMMPAPFARSADEAIQLILYIFASRVAGIAGILMAIVWTAGFLPEALSPGAASVMLAKPVPRWLFLTGKYLGVVCFIALHTTIFFFGTWLALGLRTGFWHPAYLACIPFLVFHFAMIYSFTLILAVVFRSTMACVVGGVVFWVICFGVNFGRHHAVAFVDPAGNSIPAFTSFLMEAGYWMLPKPADWTVLLELQLNLGSVMETFAGSHPIKTAIDAGHFHPTLSILSSCVFTVFCVWTSASHLSKTDY